MQQLLVQLNALAAMWPDNDRRQLPQLAEKWIDHFLKFLDTSAIGMGVHYTTIPRIHVTDTPFWGTRNSPLDESVTLKGKSSINLPNDFKLIFSCSSMYSDGAFATDRNSGGYTYKYSLVDQNNDVRVKGDMIHEDRREELMAFLRERVFTDDLTKAASCSAE